MNNITQKLAPLALAFLALAACDQTKTTPTPDTRPRVLVSNPPTAWLVKQIAGDKVIVQTLASSGGCGHEFQPTDKEIAEAGKAQIWFTCGLEFENAEWGKGIKKVSVCEGGHAWMSMKNLYLMGTQIEKNLITSPKDKTENVMNIFLDAEILDHDSHIAKSLLPLKSQAFLADHPAYTYFAADYGLKQIVMEEDGHEPTDADLAKVIADAKAAGVKIMFLSSEGHRGEAEAVAKAVGAQVILADPNSENTPELLEMMANALVKAHAR